MTSLRRLFLSLLSVLLIAMALPASTWSQGTVRPEPDPLAEPPAAPVARVKKVPVKAEAEPVADLPPGEGEFVRYIDTEDRQELQTAIVRYVKGDKIVDLVGAVHIGDPEYFDELNTQLEQYDAVLYEMVGGEVQTRADRQDEVAPEFGQVQMAHGLIQKVLGMEYQLDGIDYGKSNFIHADVDWTQYQSLMAERNQSLATLFQRAMELAQNGEGPAILTDETAGNQMIGTLISGLTTGNTAELKRAMAPFLGEAESFIAHIEGDDGTVLVTERNKVVMGILDRELKRGRRNVAVFYGAGHLPDLEERLIAEGYRRDAGVWLTAWDIVEPEPGQGTNLWQALFSDPELIQGMMSGVQEMLKQLQGEGVDSAPGANGEQ